MRCSDRCKHCKKSKSIKYTHYCQFFKAPAKLGVECPKFDDGFGWNRVIQQMQGRG